MPVANDLLGPNLEAASHQARGRHIISSPG